MTQPSSLRAELRALIEYALSTDDPVGTLMGQAYQVEDEWDEVDVSTLGEGRGSQVISNRFLVVRIPRQSERRTRSIDRTVGGGRRLTEVFDDELGV